MTAEMALIYAAVIAATPPTIVAFAAWRQGKRNEAQGKRQAAEVIGNTAITKATLHKTDELLVKAEEIHDLTNSNLTKVQADLESANKRIHEMQESTTTSLEAANKQIKDMNELLMSLLKKNGIK